MCSSLGLTITGWDTHISLVPLRLVELLHNLNFGERGGLVVKASDFGSRGRGFEPHSGQTAGLPRSGKKVWKMKFFPVQGKVREFQF